MPSGSKFSQHTWKNFTTNWSYCSSIFPILPTCCSRDQWAILFVEGLNLSSSIQKILGNIKDKCTFVVIRSSVTSYYLCKNNGCGLAFNGVSLNLSAHTRGSVLTFTLQFLHIAVQASLSCEYLVIVLWMFIFQSFSSADFTISSLIIIMWQGRFWLAFSALKN